MSQSRKRPLSSKEGSLSSSTTTPAKNAFAVLLKASQQHAPAPSRPAHKKTSGRRKSLIRFIPCPAGCGQHVSVHNVNRHLDQCMKAEPKSAGKKDTRVDDHSSSSVNMAKHGPYNRSPSAQPQSVPSSPIPVISSTQVLGPAVVSNQQSPPKVDRAMSAPLGNDTGTAPSLPRSLSSSNDGKTGTVVSPSQSLFPLSQKSGESLSATTLIDDAHPPRVSLVDGGSATSSGADQASLPNHNNNENSAVTIANTPNTATDEATATIVPNTKPSTALKTPQDSTTHPNTQVSLTTKTANASSSTGSNELFAHMMARSKQVFQKKPVVHDSDKVPECWFWFSPQDGVSLQPTACQTVVRPAWTATVQLRNGPRVHLATMCLAPSNAQRRRRYVRHHSRLSVPVLKSILQKSIRRRKPLPSVRVALELADKSLGEFLRRLPIIVLEDSTLHPDMGSLVWLMMAQSKDYDPPPEAMALVFRVVFEISSCQWQDSLRLEQSALEQVPLDFTVVLDKLHRGLPQDEKSGNSKQRQGVLTNIFSMLARASYGGMHGDVQMLHQFAALWFHRMNDYTESVSRSASPPIRLGPDEGVLSWCEIPVSIHRRAREQSTRTPGVFTDLIRTGIDCLLFNDVTVEGVDFHCSAVVDHLVNDSHLVQLSVDLLILSNEEDFPESTEERREFLSRIWRSCMWDYASGVNRRRPLVAPEKSNSTTRENESGRPASNKYEHLWKSLVAKKALEFQKKYVEDRLFALA